MSRPISVREKAIDYLRKGKGTGSTIGGGNVLLNAGQHALGGAEHTGQLPADRVSVEPAGALVATDAQAALEELDSDLTTHLADTVDAHDASAVSFIPTGTLASTNVQDAIVEAATEAGSTSLPWFDMMLDGGLTGDGTTDDTAAFQAALATGTAAGTQSCTFYFPPGTYLIAGALQDTGAFNGQILLPDIPVDITHPQLVLHFQGASRPPFALVPTQPVPDPNGYSIIKSTLTGASGTAAVISAGNAPYNNISVVIEDLICLAPSDPSLTFWNLLNSQAATIRDLMIFTSDWLGGVVPTHSNAYGIKLPGDTQGNYTRIQGLAVRNHYVGIRGGDLVVASGLMISICIVGWENPASGWPSIINDVYFNGTISAIAGTGGPSVLDVLRYSHEHYPSDPDWATLYDLDDPNDYIYGAIRWWNVEWAVGPDHIFTVNGGANTSNAEVGPLTSVDPDDVRDAGRWEVVMVPGVTSPPDPLQTVAGDDWVYGWVPG